MAAKNILAGGVHYRDIFDTNTPGFVWLLVVIRSVVGWSPEALRATDLLVLGSLVLTLARLARQGGASGRNILWLVAGCVGFYLFAHEMTHAQRDVWLAVPALWAVAGRLKRIVRPIPGLFHGVFRPAAVEGVLWAAAVWIKPHFLFVAVFAWVFTAFRLAGERAAGGGWKRWLAVLLTDAAGSLLAGGLMGVAGVGYMLATGTWGPFVEVMTVWNVGYLGNTFAELHLRANAMLGWFPPWNFLLPLTAAVAVGGVIDARSWAGRFRPPAGGGLFARLPCSAVWHKGGTDEQRYARAVLGAVYLVWVAQGLILQRPYHYVHAVEVMLGLAVWAGYRWNAAALVAVWLLLVQVGWAVAPQTFAVLSQRSYDFRTAVTPHPIFDRNRMRHWPECFLPLDDGAEARRLDAVKLERAHPASFGWVELDEVAGFLRDRQVGDRELVCWHDSPHALYLLLDVKPGLRFMHVDTARLISDDCDHRVCDEMRANTAARFAVIDLRWYAYQEPNPVRKEAYNEPGGADDLLPPVAGWLHGGRFDDAVEPELPFDTSHSVFRSGGGRGRYVVFQLKD